MLLEQVVTLVSFPHNLLAPKKKAIKITCHKGVSSGHLTLQLQDKLFIQ